MSSFWLSSNLTTQNWMADRSEFVFTCITSRLSDYYQGQMSDQLDYTQILHGISEEIAKVDAVCNYIYDQNSASLNDIQFAHVTEAPLFKLTTSFPRPIWYDTTYRLFLSQVANNYLKITTKKVIKDLFQAYFRIPYEALDASIEVTELWDNHTKETETTLFDQHIANIRLPMLIKVDQTTLDAFTVFDNVRQAHTVFRIIASPARADYIHGATLTDPYYLKLYIYEDRNPVVILKWSDYSSWFKVFTGPFMHRSQAQSGVFAPGVLPNARYSSSYSFTES